MDIAKTINYFGLDYSSILGDPNWVSPSLHYHDGIMGRDNCPLCAAKLFRIKYRDLLAFSEIDKYYSDMEESISLYAVICNNCNWFVIIKQITDYERRDFGYTGFTRSVLKNFDLQSADAPVEALATYLLKKPIDIMHIHHKKMEELVCAIFREHFNCEVIHCGRTGDKGIDLFLVQADELIPVQVKRRMSEGKTEPVDTVTKMLGVMFRDSYSKAMIVTTADKFSQPAKDDVSKVEREGKVEKIDLINLHDFMSIMNRYYAGKEKYHLDIAKSMIEIKK